jgi:iron-sulfur cluster assembly protein
LKQNQIKLKYHQYLFSQIFPEAEQAVKTKMLLTPILYASAKTAATATVRAVKRRSLIPTRAALTLTPSAVAKVKQIVEHKPNCIGLQIGVKKRGCNGLSYTLDYAMEKIKFSEEVEQDGVKVFIDSKAQLTLLGTEMDYYDSKLSSEFVFNNPNITGTCGCGESFTVQ